MKKAHLSSLKKKCRGNIVYMGSLPILPWSMGGLVKELFFLFFSHQSILCGDSEAQVITFFLHRQGVCFSSHIEGNRGYPKFLFFFSFAYNWASHQEWINSSSCECHKTLCANTNDIISGFVTPAWVYTVWKSPGSVKWSNGSGLVTERLQIRLPQSIIHET